MTHALETTMRIRRESPTRLEGFVDASFAFAITLVVIAIGRVPASVEEMLTALHGLPTFALCFLLLARLWSRHREWSRWYDLEDAVAVRLSLLLVFIVLIYVYPLRMLFAQMFIGLSGGRLGDGSVQALTRPQELRAAYVVFGLGLGAISLVFALLFGHALRRADSIGLSAAERAFTRMKIRIWAVQFATAALSIGLACWMPMQAIWMLMVPGLVYVAGMPIARVARIRFRREIAALGAAPA